MKSNPSDNQIQEKEEEEKEDQVIFRIENESNLVWRFPLHISQSSLAGKTQLSNACTLIALKIAEILHNHQVFMPLSLYRKIGGLDRGTSPPLHINNITNTEEDSKRRRLIAASSSSQNCPPAIFAALVNGIIDGNEAYENDAGATSTRVYNLPDAIKACGMTFTEIDFKLCYAKMAESLPRMIHAAVKCPAFRDDQRLIFVMIGCIRTVLLVYERATDSLTLFDTHMHLLYDVDRNDHFRHGALIASSKMSNVRSFAVWIECNIFPDISTSSMGEFEISMVRLVHSEDIQTQKTCQTFYRKLDVPEKFPIFNSVNDENNNNNNKEKEKIAPVDKYPILRSLLSIPPKRSWVVAQNGGVENGGKGRKLIKLCT